MRVTLPSGTPAELVTTDGAVGGLVIAPDIGGLRPLFDDMAARLAGENDWNVIAVEPFPGHTFPPDDVQARLDAVHELHDLRVLGDLVAAAALVGVDAAADVGLIGFCMGGMYVHKAAATGRFRRSVSFYGMIELPDGWKSAGQTEPIAALRAAADPSDTLAVVGTADPYTPPEAVERLIEVGVRVADYDGAEHGFVHDPSRPAHRPDDAADAWARAIAHLTG